MKVICINHDLFEDDLPYGPDDPQVGEVCTVIDICIGYDEKGKGFPSYELEGYSPWVYDQRNFAPLSDLDETELVTEEFEEKYFVPVKS